LSLNKTASAPDDVCPGPDLNPRNPSIEVPAGACDCHVHIYAPPERHPYKEKRRYTPAPEILGPGAYLKMADALGLERAVLVQPGIYPDNEVTVEALKASGGKWRGVAAVLDANVSRQELKRLDEAGFRGVRFNPRNTKLVALKDLEIIAGKIAEFGWHAQIHMDARDLVDLADRFRKLPVDIVIDHMGRIPPAEAGIDHPGFQALLALMREGKCWVKLSAPNRFGDPRPPYPQVVPIARALVQAAPERCVWASDWPHTREYGHMPNDGELLNLLAVWAPDAGDRRLILVDNPARLYRF